MPSQLLFTPLRAVDSNGNPISGAKLTFYESGTTTPLTVYTASDLSTAHPTPIVSDASGVFDPVWFDGSGEAKVIMTDASDVTLDGFPMDPVPFTSASGSTAAATSFSPVTGNAATDVQAAIENLTTFQNESEDLGGDSLFASAAQGIKADNALPAADLVELTQGQVEGDTDTTFGVVSGERLRQAFDQAFSESEKQIGVDQTWQDVSGSRVAGTIYTNNTGKPIMVNIFADGVGDVNVNIHPASGGSLVIDRISNEGASTSFIVPNGDGYSVDSSFSLLEWSELR